MCQSIIEQVRRYPRLTVIRENRDYIEQIPYMYESGFIYRRRGLVRKTKS